MAIQEMDLTIKHRSGRSNASADALSQNPVSKSEPVEVCAIEISHSETGGVDENPSIELSDATKQKLSNL